jgi:hypothetical protein
MPFQVPMIVSYQAPTPGGARTLVEPAARPDGERLAQYIDWLEAELTVAKAAFLELTGDAYEGPSGPGL